MEKRDLGICQDEIQVAVTLTAFMTGVTMFFTGLLLTEFSSFDISIKIPILFLIISTFGFLYSTLIFGNASGQLSRLDHTKFDKFMLVGDYVSEYLGVYFLVLAIPLVINVITQDNFLRLATLLVALGGLLLYQVGGFSIMERNFKKLHYVFMGIIILLEVLASYTQIYLQKYFVYISMILLAFILLITYLAKKED